MPPILLLDVMGTLVRDPFFEDLPRHFGLTFEALLRDKHPRAWIDFESGHIDEATFVRRFFADGRHVDLDALRGCVAAGYRFLPGIEALLEELRGRGVEMHALSNYPPWYRLIEARLGLGRFLRWSFVSCETGVRKPAPQAYLGALERLGVPATRCLFVDDAEGNCAAARAVGIDAVRFAGAPALREELARRGVL